MHNHSADVVILGGGVIGMTSALSLADAGQQVIVLEAGQLGQEASWAGGGIMSPLYPWRYPRPLDALLARSLKQIPALVERLCDQTAHDPELYRTGLWVLGLDEAEQRSALAWGEAQQWQLHDDKSEFPASERAAEPSADLVEAARSSVWFPQVANIRNPRLIHGLAALLKAHANVRVFEQTRVQALKSLKQSKDSPLDAGGQGKGIWSVRTQNLQVQAPKVVCAAGAWSSELLAASGMSVPKVQPALGQMLLLKPTVTRELPMVLWNGRYIVPRKDGQVLVGSTVEYCGFKKQWAEQAQKSLLAFAEQVIGCPLEGQVQAHWAGLRPDAGQALPIIGEHPQQPGLFLNTGHFRNGLVLALGSAELLTAQIMGMAAEINTACFVPKGARYEADEVTDVV